MPISRFFQALLQPHYVYRPLQLFRRIYREWTPSTSTSEIVSLPWNHSIRVNPTEHIGRSVWLHGIYDTTVCEILWRLTEPGMKVVDAGANVGIMTSLFAHRAGPHGSVYAFEPHPYLYAVLAENVRRFRLRCNTDLRPLPFALDDQSGPANLTWGSTFHSNHGLASLSESAPQASNISVTCTTLDVLFPSSDLDILKIDVQGFEPRVVAGSDKLLSDGRIDHVLYECHAGLRSFLHERFRTYGYSIFGLESTINGVNLLPISKITDPSQPGVSSSFLATRLPARTNELTTPNGWKCLRCID